MSMITRTFWLVLAALLTTVVVGCQDTRDGDDENDPNYKPNKAVFKELRNQYAREPVYRAESGDLEAIGHSANTTDQPLAESLVLNDANTVAANYLIRVDIRDAHPEAARYFRENTGIVKRLLRPILEQGERAWHQLPVGKTRDEDGVESEVLRYDMYARYRMPQHRLEGVVRALVDYWKKVTQYPDPQDLEIPVVLTGLKQSLTYQQRMALVVDGIQRVVDELEYRGEVVALDMVNSELSADELQDRKRRLIAQIPQGGEIEVSYVFEYVSSRRVESIRLKDWRNRYTEPIPVIDHPRSVGGRYRYSIPVHSHWIRKGDNITQISIKEVGGREITQEYDLRNAPDFQFTDNNVGLVEIRDFQGYLSNLTKRMSSSIQLPGEGGRVVELVFYEPKVTLTGRPGAGEAGGGVRLNFVIGVNRPSLENVWYLPYEDQPDPGTLSDATAIERLNWQIAWERNDPDGRWGSSDRIEVQGTDDQRRVYVKVEYNAGRDFDVLLFDFNNRDLRQPLRQAQKIFSTTDSNSSFERD